MILLVDNYDSFTYNLFQLLSELGAGVTVVRNDKLTVADVTELTPAGIVISPGPGRPEGAGISAEIIRAFGQQVPVLGVCLGHQCIASVYGGEVVSARELMHGKSSRVYHSGSGIFAGLENPFDAIRYHSLTIDPASVPDSLEVTARTDTGTIMGVRHREHPVEGVQFHPESILTSAGRQLMLNWLAAIPSARQLA
jgi:anthranilate synthase/aminodeoxychorismate synthase-like glutamine amidotransferase